MKKIYLLLIIMVTSFMHAQLDVKDLSVIYNNGKTYKPGDRIDFTFLIKGTYNDRITLKLYEGNNTLQSNLIALSHWNSDGDNLVFNSYTKRFWWNTVSLNKSDFEIKDRGVTLLISYKGQEKKLYYKPELKIKNLKLASNSSATIPKGGRLYYDFDIAGTYDEHINLKLFQTNGSSQNLVYSGKMNSEDDPLNYSTWTTINYWVTVTKANGFSPSNPLFLVLEYKGVSRVISNKYRLYGTKIHSNGGDREAAINSFCANQQVNTRTFVLRSNDPLEIGELYTFNTRLGNITYRNFEEINSIKLSTATSVDSFIRYAESASSVETTCRNSASLQFEELLKNNFKSDCNAPVTGCTLDGHYIYKSTFSKGMNFKVSVKNNGDRVSETAYVHVYLWANDDPEVAFYKPKNVVYKIDPLNPNQIRSSIEFYFDDKGSFFDENLPAGNYTLQIRIEETLEGNSDFSEEVSLDFQVRAGDPPSGGIGIILPIDADFDAKSSIQNKNYSVTIFNLQGILVKQKTVANELEEQNLIQELPKGFYIIKSDQRTYKVAK